MDSTGSITSNQMNPTLPHRHIDLEQRKKIKLQLIRMTMTLQLLGPKPDQATQKRKVKALTLNDLTRWFHVTIVQAAKELQLSPTAIKHKCPEFGVERWPSRTVESYNKKILILEKSIREGTSKPNASREMENLREKLDDIYSCRPERDGVLPAARGRRRTPP
ncbi:protein RKD5-like isoform X2 [Papaver somniferum]|uniref:protein RKD5-like isoform X2 n=1 Tax=Papaver somniferum TaxID=3469 RepID=UPI000E6F61FA|nr:protein RKD5-like isoform X2 [Papaver somniferum]